MLGSLVQFDDAPGVSGDPITSYNMKRVSITFFAPLTGSVTLSNDPITKVGAGIVLSAGSNPIYLHVTTHGEVVQRPWFAIYSGTLNPVAWIEALA